MSDGTTPYTTFNVSGFSAGTTGLTAANLTTDAAAGTVVLSGTPTAAGTASFTVNVTDTAGATLTKTYTLTVNRGARRIAPAALAEATAGTATSQTITVSGGTKPYTTFSISGFSAGDHRADGGQPHHRCGGGNGDAERHADGGGHGELHGQRHRHRRRDPDQDLHADGQPGAEHRAGDAGDGHGGDGDQPDHHGVGRHHSPTRPSASPASAPAPPG